MDTTTQTFELPDGRTLGYSEFGDSSGIPVLYFHGWPACRLEAKLYHAAAESAGVRLISPDRPGFGVSSFQADRCLLDWVEDVGHLADHLGLNKFHILGHSGGGPYAAACALQIPGRLLGTTVVAGVSSMENPATREGMRKMNQFLLTIGKRFPWILDRMMKMMAKMSQSPDNLSKGIKDLPEVDRQLFEAFIPDAVEIMTGAFEQGTEAASQEGVLYSKPWGFELSSITVPVKIWQGSLDVNVPLSNGEIYAEEIPAASLSVIEGEGHFSMAFNHGKEIFEDLLGGS